HPPARVAPRLSPGPQAALLVPLARVGYEHLAVAAEDADADDADPRRGTRLVHHRTAPRRILGGPVTAGIEEILVGHRGHHRGRALLDVGRGLVAGASLALAVRHLLLRLVRGRRLPRRQVDRRDRARPGAHDLDAEQRHDHTEEHVEDRPASHQVAPGLASGGPGGGAAGAPPGASLGGASAGAPSPPPAAASPSPGPVPGSPSPSAVSASGAFALASARRYPLTSTVAVIVRGPFAPGTAPRRLASRNGMASCCGP